MLLSLATGIFYFTWAVTGDVHLSTCILNPVIAMPLLFLGGILLFFGSLHLVRAIGQWHGRFAKHVLVEASVD